MLTSLRGYRPAWLTNDLIAGLLLAAIAIPEQIATARLAGMPPQAGLYAFAAGSLAFAIFGRNRYLSVGADSTISPIFAGAIVTIALTAGAAYPTLVAVAALFTGIGLILAGVLRAGWIADLLSIPVRIGFLAGISIRIILGQLPAVLGVHVSETTFFATVGALVAQFSHTSGMSLMIGVGVLLLTMGAERIGPRIPGALIGLIGACIAVAIFHLDQHGVAVLGALPAALPHPTLQLISFKDALQLLPVALIVALVCMVQTTVVLRSYPSNVDVPEDPSHDFIALGVASIAAAAAGTFAVDSSPPRTAVVESSGGRSQLASIVAVAAVILLLLFGAQLTAYLPLAALGGILIFVGLRIFKVNDMRTIAKLGSGEIWLVVAGAALVVALPIETGMVLAIILSLIHGVYSIARPPSTEMRRVPGTTIWWPPDHTPNERVPGVLVFAPAAPIMFTNVQYIIGRLQALVAATPDPLKLVVIEASGVIDIDYTGARMLCPVIADLQSRGIDVALARVSDQRTQTAVTATGLSAEIGADHTFRSVQEAIDALGPASSPAPSK